MSELTKFDKWFNDDGPAALVIREHLIPIEGPEGVFFPATYAAQQGADRDKEKFQGGYNIDTFADDTNVCLVDSVGSQANRIEPLFAKPGCSDLVPQMVVTFPSKGLRLNLLHANHRAADAITSVFKTMRFFFCRVYLADYVLLTRNGARRSPRTRPGRREYSFPCACTSAS